MHDVDIEHKGRVLVKTITYSDLIQKIFDSI